MLQRLRNRAQGQEGFTLIELLVVILIIGILAAVAIPTFLGQSKKAQDANAQANLQTVQNAESEYYTSNNAYTTSLTSLETTEPAINQFATKLGTSLGTTAQYGAADSGATVNWAVNYSSSSGASYAITAFSDGTYQYTCRVATGTPAGACQNLGTASGGYQTGTWANQS